MADMFNTGVSALLANQRLLLTTSHNIANVNTDGYSRQRVELAARTPQFSSAGFLGKGVDVSAITRGASEFLTGQVRANTSSEASASAFVDLANQVDEMLGSGTFAPALERFYNAIHDVNNDPSSASARIVLLNSAETLVQRFQDTDAQLATLARNVNDSLAQQVNRINALTASIARLNKEIVEASGLAQGASPNDLLDQRDMLLKDLSKIVNVTTLTQDDGALNVFVGNGQLLVAGARTVALAVTPNSLDTGRSEVSVVSGGATTVISGTLTSGELAGVLEFRDEILDPSRNAIGRLAAGLALSYNAQHAQGMDLNGALGGDLFAIGSPIVNAAAGNSGAISVAIDPANLGNLTVSDYRLSHDGANFTLTRLSDGTQQTLSGAGPFSVDGLTITLAAAPAAGDTYLIQPTRGVTRGMAVVITDPQALAFANPVKTAAALANIGSGAIGVPQILDETNAALLTPVQLVFNDPPTTFQINGAGPLIPYTGGGNIDINGWRVQISGSPAAGDTFGVDPNFNGHGDNGNGLALIGLRAMEILEGGTATFQDAYSQLVGSVGARTEQAQISNDALRVLRENAEASRDALAGVNLDEEAANLLRFQQSYQGATQVIQAANDMFNALLEAMRN